MAKVFRCDWCGSEERADVPPVGWVTVEQRIARGEWPTRYDVCGVGCLAGLAGKLGEEERARLDAAGAARTAAAGAAVAAGLARAADGDVLAGLTPAQRAGFTPGAASGSFVFTPRRPEDAGCIVNPNPGDLLE